ncbi:MAG: MoaD/ThiS family protein [Anaerolineae bacterium]|nr:MoaD/ThiS family protein [Anaerolineae bacterium]
MPNIRFTTHLQRFFPELKQGVSIEGATVAQVVAALDRTYPGMADYIVDEHGKLRQHVNIFVDENLITDRQSLTDPVTERTQVFIFQALSGG